MSPAPEADAPAASAWRKAGWWVLAATIVVPPILAVGILASSSREESGATWPAAHPVLTLVAAAAVFGLGRLGLRWRWHARSQALWTAGATALLAVGFSTALASADRQVRQSSIDKVILCEIRQLSAAADQYYLENGVTSVDFAHLVGATNYLKAVQPVANEVYPTYYTQGITITVEGIAGARTVTYAP